MTTTKTFTFTGALQPWTVPATVTSIAVTCNGAAGGGYTGLGTQPNAGGQATGTLAVTPGQLLYVGVGGVGQPPNGNNYGLGGWNGGGRGGIGTGYPTYYGGAGGGGSSGVRLPTSTTRSIIAGGGGGRVSGQVGGGAGGGTTGIAGNAVGTGAGGGGGGTPTAGGAYGTGGGGGGTAGALQTGGIGGGNTVRNGAGGGGGGYWGGGGGGITASTGLGYGGGGGGSSYVTGVGVTGGATTVGGGSTGNGTVVFVYNQTPNSPQLLAPSTNANIDVTIAQTFTWAFSDPDVGDTQSAADFQYRIVGSGTWTTVLNAATTAQQYTLAGATLTTASQYEWQVRTSDQSGLQGPWSGSGIFNTTGGPSAPTALSPATAGAITSNTQTVTWTVWASGQSGHRVKIVDNATPTTVYYDSGVVFSATPSQVIALPPSFVSGTTVQVTVQYFLLTGVWSPVTTSTGVTTNLNPPGVPTITFTPHVNAGSLDINVFNPNSGSTPSTNYLYRDDVNDVTATEVIIALLSASLGVTQTYTDNTVGFNRLYRYRVVAFSQAGGGTSS